MWSCNFVLEKYFWLGEAEQVKENTHETFKSFYAAVCHPVQPYREYQAATV